ncbi:hypothetical protein [Variovorax paradoxus]
MDQSFVSRINFNEYSIRLVRPNRDISEAECASIGLPNGGGGVGYLIPGAAILSKENKKNANSVYSAYRIIVAYLVCTRALQNNFDLCDPKYRDAQTAEKVFAQDCYYLVTWDKKIPDSQNFIAAYSLCFAKRGLILTEQQTRPLFLPLIYDPATEQINLHSALKYPEHIGTLLTRLFPFTENPFLRFFYLYQIIEHLMSEEFDKFLEKLRVKLNAAQDPSTTEVRDWIQDFTSSVKEDSRIRAILQPICSKSAPLAELLLDELNIDRTKMLFPDMIYKIRNVLFHDYKTIHSAPLLVAELGDRMYGYLFEKKLSI